MNTASKQEYDSYIHPTVVDKKTGVVRNKEVREMTAKQYSQHKKIFNYWIKNIQPYLCETN